MSHGKVSSCSRGKRFAMKVHPHPGPLPSVGRGRITRRALEIPETGYAEGSIAKPEPANGCSLSPGERVGVRASVSTKLHFALASRADDADIRRLLCENP